jgi:cytochrome c oxidase subunit 2
MHSPWLLAVSDTSPHNLSIFDPVSPPAQSIHLLAILVLAITGGIFLVVEGVLIYSLFRFRRGTTPPTTEPPQVYGSKPIEIAWTAAPALIVLILTLVVARTEWEVSVDPERFQPDLKDSRPLRVTVVGHQWWWEYVYEKDGDEPLHFTTANELHIPATNFDAPSQRRPVYLTLKSADVAHSFWVPRLAGKVDLIPGKTNSLWFETDHTGLFVGQCAEFCGTQHANMLLRVYVDPPDEFSRWLASQRERAWDQKVGLARGKEIFLKQTCVSCHRVRGAPEAKGNVGPDLTHLMSRATLAGGMIENDREGKNLRDWIADPQKVKPGCLMPAFGLSKEDLDDVVQYLRALE